MCGLEAHVPLFQSVFFKGALRFEVRDPSSIPCLEETSSKIHPFELHSKIIPLNFDSLPTLSSPLCLLPEIGAGGADGEREIEGCPWTASGLSPSPLPESHTQEGESDIYSSLFFLGYRGVGKPKL